MLTPDYLDTLPDALVELWQQVEEDILQDIARRIAKMERVTDTADWQLWRFEQIQALHQDVAALLAKYSGKTTAEIRRLLLEAGRQALASDDELYRALGFSPSSIETSEQLNNLLNAGYRQTLGSWQNLTATTANTVTGEFERALDRAWLQISSGAFDYKTAIKQAVDGLAQRMAGVTYPSGHRDTLEVAVRRAVLTGVNQTSAQLQLARMEEMDCNFVEVTAHGGARPQHAVWQGKIYHRGGAVVYEGVRYEDFASSTGYGTGPGLCGWNCRHNFYPFFPGLSSPNWDQRQLEALNAKEMEYGGQMYSRYEISQMQRQLEREVRKAKRRYLAEDAAGLDATQAAVQLKAARQKLAAFVRDIGGRADSQRTGVAGFGRSAASKANWAYRKNIQPQKLLYAKNISDSQRSSIEEELSLLPLAQREAAERQISMIRMDSGLGGSGYNTKTKELILSPDRNVGDVIHEYAHALERELDLLHNDQYRAIRVHGLDLADFEHVVYDDTTFTKPIFYLENKKFISIYQGRIYDHPVYGLFTPEGNAINIDLMLEYFSEGYREYYINPDNLQQHDPELYNFIKGLLK